jgi:hypothetical protein
MTVTPKREPLYSRNCHSGGRGTGGSLVNFLVRAEAEVGRSRGRLQAMEGRLGHSARGLMGASGGGCGAHKGSWGRRGVGWSFGSQLL